MEWKETYEKETKTSYIKKTGTKRKHGSSTGTTTYLCNRSGEFHSKGLGKRMLKSQGSCKIGHHCTSQLSVSSDHSSGSVSVVLCETHYGHGMQIEHLRLSKSEREKIAGQLKMGITQDRILDDIRNSLTSTSLDRVHLLSKKDIANIEQLFGLTSIERHRDDATSVAMFLEEMESTGNPSPILYNKFQKEPATNCLKEDDMMIVVQTSLQAELMKSCTNGKIVCMDSTHGTNGYGFYLISILVVDEFGEGVPVAWCVCNREDEVVLTQFLTVIKNHIDVTCVPAWFMSDMAPQFYTAWTKVFGVGPKKLLCAWHIDRAWRSNLSKIDGTEKKAEVYKH